jgi:large repetitive protein
MSSIRANITRKTKAQSAKKALGLLVFLVGALIWQTENSFADIVNTATATGSYLGTGYPSNSSSVAVPVGTANRSMVVTKSASPNSNVTAGTVVTYTYTVKNNGNVTLTNINLNDLHNAAGPAPTPKSETLTDIAPLGDSTDVTANDGVWSVLAPGDTVTLTGTYTVQQSDVDTLQ